MTVTKTVPEVRESIIKILPVLGGRIAQADGRSIQCDFGSLLKSRLLGEFWVSASTLPKRATIGLQDAENGGTKITVDVRDTHKYGLKLGFVKKYEKALEELADTIMTLLK